MVSFAHLLQNILLLSALIITSSCYHLVYDNSTSYNWNEAQSFCQSSYGTNLATAQTQQELNELISMRDAVFDSNVYLYIGLNDQNEEGIFKWISGESCDPNADGTLCVTYWKANEPSNSGGIEHCTALIYAVNGISEIYDESCDRERNQFFCDAIIIEPTFQPTKSPSEQPTHYPTQVTNEPTALPTHYPTQVTNEPTALPTHYPTQVTNEPTALPTHY
eukprot:198649_1